MGHAGGPTVSSSASVAWHCGKSLVSVWVPVGLWMTMFWTAYGLAAGASGFWKNTWRLVPVAVPGVVEVKVSVPYWRGAAKAGAATSAAVAIASSVARIERF